MDARALRLRNNIDAGGPQRDLHVYGNTFVATTGPGLARRAYGVHVSYVNPRGQMDGANVLLEHNTIRAVVTTADPAYRATRAQLPALGYAYVALALFVLA